MFQKSEPGSELESHTKPIVLGELSAEENSTLDKLVKFGLGFALDKSCEIQIKDELPSASGLGQLYDLKECAVKLCKLKLDGNGPIIVKRKTISGVHSMKTTDPESSSDESITYDPKKFSENLAVNMIEKTCWSIET